MKDADKATLASVAPFIPFMLVAFLAFYLGGLWYKTGMITGNSWLDFFLILGLLFLGLPFQIHPRIKHYNKAFDDFRREYRYQEEA